MKYVPILRGKLGEFKGLNKLENHIKSEIHPFLRLCDPDLDYDHNPPKWKCDHKTQFLKITKNIEKHFSDEIPFFLDFETDPEIKILGKHYSEFVFNELNKTAVRYSPVISFDRISEPGYIESIKNIGMLKSEKFCLRFPKEYIEAISLYLDDIKTITDLFQNFSICILLDLEQIDNIDSAKELVQTALEALDGMEYDKLIVSSACMPETMSDFDSNETSTQSRLDWELWALLSKQYDVIYSDYTILNPSLQNINPRTMTRTSRIRYSTVDSIVVFKGESNKKTPSKIQNPKLANMVQKHTEFKGEKFSWGDKYIIDCCEATPGSPTTWISAEINHHITLVVGQISNYFDS